MPVTTDPQHSGQQRESETDCRGSSVGHQQCRTQPVAVILVMGEAAELRKGKIRMHFLGYLWPVRLTRATVSSVSASLSAPSSPQPSPQMIAPSAGAADSPEEEVVVFAELVRSFGAVGNARSHRHAALESRSRLSQEPQ